MLKSDIKKNLFNIFSDYGCYSVNISQINYINYGIIVEKDGKKMCNININMINGCDIELRDVLLEDIKELKEILEG